MNKELIQSLYERIKNGLMAIDDIPDGAVKQAVQELIDAEQ